MKPSNIFSTAENYRLYNNASNGSSSKKSSKKNPTVQNFNSEKIV